MPSQLTIPRDRHFHWNILLRPIFNLCCHLIERRFTFAYLGIAWNLFGKDHLVDVFCRRRRYDGVMLFNPASDLSGPEPIVCAIDGFTSLVD